MPWRWEYGRCVRGWSTSLVTWKGVNPLATIVSPVSRCTWEINALRYGRRRVRYISIHFIFFIHRTLISTPSFHVKKEMGVWNILRFSANAFKSKVTLTVWLRKKCQVLTLPVFFTPGNPCIWTKPSLYMTAPFDSLSNIQQEMITYISKLLEILNNTSRIKIHL